MVPLAIDAFSLKLGVSGDSILGIFAKGKLPLRCISNLTLGVTNEGREAITVAPRTGSTTPVPPPAPSPPPICSRGGGFDADGPATSGAFFFGGMSMKAMEIYLARTPDQVYTTSTPPTWRAKDVEGNRPPRTPMGTEPLLGSAGGGGCAKSGSRRHTHNFGPHGCV